MMMDSLFQGKTSKNNEHAGANMTKTGTNDGNQWKSSKIDEISRKFHNFDEILLENAMLLCV